MGGSKICDEKRTTWKLQRNVSVKYPYTKGDKRSFSFSGKCKRKISNTLSMSFMWRTCNVTCCCIIPICLSIVWWLLISTLDAWMSLIALSLGLTLTFGPKTMVCRVFGGSRELSSGSHIIKKWAVLLWVLFSTCSCSVHMVPGKDQWAALEDAVCIHKLTKNIQGQLLNVLIIVQTCSFVVYRVVDCTLEEQLAKVMWRREACECRWAGISFSHRHTVEENGLIFHYVFIFVYWFCLGKIQCSFSRMNDESSAFQLSWGWERHWVQRN